MSDEDDGILSIEAIEEFHKSGAAPETAPVVEAGAEAAEPEPEHEPEAKPKSGVIPLARHETILKNQREKQQEQIVEMTAKLAFEAGRIGALEAKLLELSEKPATPANIAKADALNERLERLREELPEGISEDFIGVFEEQRARSERLESLLAAQAEQLSSLKSEREEYSHAQMQADRDKAVSMVPDISAWQDAANHEGATLRDRMVWEAAKTLDNELKASPEWADKSLSERFSFVAKEVRAAMGLQPARGKALPAAVARPPASLSSIPGGAPPADTGIDAFLSQDPMQIAAMAQRMTPAQWEAYVARLG